MHLQILVEYLFYNSEGGNMDRIQNEKHESDELKLTSVLMNYYIIWVSN